MRVFDSILSAIAAIRASAALGRATRMQTRGDLAGALAEGRRGLRLLGESHVRRRNAPEGSALVSLTILVESVGCDLGDTGASSRDLRDSIDFLKRLPEEPPTELQTYLPYLETRLTVQPGRSTA